MDRQLCILLVILTSTQAVAAVGSFHVVSPSNVAGSYNSCACWFSGQKDIPTPTKLVVAVPPKACGFGPLDNADEINGNIAVVYLGKDGTSLECAENYKAKRAELSGAVAVLIFRDDGEERPDYCVGKQPNVGSIGIPGLSVQPELEHLLKHNTTGQTIEATISHSTLKEFASQEYARYWNMWITTIAILLYIVSAWVGLVLLHTVVYHWHGLDATTIILGAIWLYSLIRASHIIGNYEDWHMTLGLVGTHVMNCLCMAIAMSSYSVLFYFWYKVYLKANIGKEGGIPLIRMKKYTVVVNAVSYSILFVWTIVLAIEGHNSSTSSTEQIGYLFVYLILIALASLSAVFGVKVVRELKSFVRTSDASMRAVFQKARIRQMVKITAVVCSYTFFTFMVMLFAILELAGVGLAPEYVVEGEQISGKWYQYQWALKILEVILCTIIGVGFTPTTCLRAIRDGSSKSARDGDRSGDPGSRSVNTDDSSSQSVSKSGSESMSLGEAPVAVQV